MWYCVAVFTVGESRLVGSSVGHDVVSDTDTSVFIDSPIFNDMVGHGAQRSDSVSSGFVDSRNSSASVERADSHRTVAKVSSESGCKTNTAVKTSSGSPSTDSRTSGRRNATSSAGQVRLLFTYGSNVSTTGCSTLTTVSEA